MKVVAICNRGLGSSLIMKFTLRDILQKLNRPDLKPTFAKPNSFKPKNVFVVICDSNSSDNIDFEHKIIMDNLFDKKELEEKLANFLQKNDPNFTTPIT